MININDSTKGEKLMTENSSFFGSDWLGAFLIIAVLFGGFGGFGFGGGAGSYDAIAAINNQSVQQGIQNVLLSSANNNFETARLVENQTVQLMNQNNTNLINAIQGFNNIGQQIMNQTNTLGSKLDQLGYQMDQCLKKIMYAIINLFAHKAVGTYA